MTARVGFSLPGRRRGGKLFNQTASFSRISALVSATP
jgi:hypothetical protein